MKTHEVAYMNAGSSSCKNVTVVIDRADDESHYRLLILLQSEFIPAEFRIRIATLTPAWRILHFMSDHLGIEGFREIIVLSSEDAKLSLSKDPIENDRFFLKYASKDVLIEQTFGGLNGASLMKALLPAVTEAQAKE